MDMSAEWWGYSKARGWVVLDRTVPCNAPGLKVALQFVRAADSSTYVEQRDKWVPPEYKFAPNYLKDLKGDDVARANEELAAFKSSWPKIRETILRDSQEVAERVAAQRVEDEKKQKADARKAKKQAAEDKL